MKNLKDENSARRDAVRHHTSFGRSAVWSAVCGALCASAAVKQPDPLPGGVAGIHVRGGAETDTFAQGARLFTDRTYTLKECPEWLSGMTFLRGSILQSDLRVMREGVLTLLTPDPGTEGAASQVRALEKDGFVWVAKPDLFQCFGNNAIDRVRIYQKHVPAGARIRLGKWAIAVGFERVAGAADIPVETETLYNGIVLPRDPRDRTDMTAYGEAPLPVPYLDAPPAVIPIDTGRQLFVDDFLIDRTTLRRTWHKAVKDARNPVMRPETDVERGITTGNAPMAAPFSGGVWYDAQDALFKVWYSPGWHSTAYAFSRDGIRWERPGLKAVPGTNLIVPPHGVRDSDAVVLDPDAPPGGDRFKMLVWGRPYGGELFTSRDGLTWSAPVPWAETGDRSTIFYNPFRKTWVYSIRSGWHARSREYSESPDFLGGAALANRVHWLRADNLDLPAERWFYAFPGREPGPGEKFKPALYNLDAVAYESLMLGAFTIMTGPENHFCHPEGLPKMTEIHLGFSRDGFHWSRPDDRTPFIPGSRAEGAWDRAYLHSNAALCLVVGDELWFYYTGFAGDPARKHEKAIVKTGMYADASMGIARLRRDGFASMDAGAGGGSLTTRPLTFARGARLFVNADATGGELRAEVLAADGTPLTDFTLASCEPMTGNSTCREIKWRGGKDLSTLRNTPVRFRFNLSGGRLYAFWISGSNGASHGYLAGGGPGFDGLTDTTGRTAGDRAAETNRQ